MRFEIIGNTFTFDNGATFPARQPVEIFQVQDRAASGKLQTENLGVQLMSRTLTFVKMTKHDYEGLLDWFLNVARGGEVPFLFENEYGEEGTVVFTMSKIDFPEVSYQRYSGSVTMEYV